LEIAREGAGAGARARTGLGWLLSGRLLLAGLSLGLAVAIDRVESSPDGTAIWGVYWTIIAAFMATIVSAHRVERTRDPRRFATLQVGIDVAIVTSLVYFSGGGDSVFTFLYALVVLYGALSLDRGGVFLAVGLASAGYALVLFGAELGLLPAMGSPGRDRPLPLLGAYWGFYDGALLVLGMLANTLAVELRRTGAALDRRTTDLRRLRDLHRRTVESIGSGLLTTDEYGEIMSFNPEAERITGVSASQAEGQRLDEMIPGAGTILDSADGKACEHEPGERGRIPYRSRRGEELFLGLAASRLIDEHGEPGGYVVIFQDVTAVVSMEQELRRSERLAAVGAMAARMAHEIRNPLASISGSVQILRSSEAKDADEGDRDPERVRLMEIVVREVDRLNVLIGDFLRYSRPAPTRLESVDLSALIEEIGEMSRAQCTPSARPRFELDLEPGVRVMADPDQLKSVVWNLWNNAIEAMAAGAVEGEGTGCLSTRVRRAEGDAAQAQDGSDRKKGSGSPAAAAVPSRKAVIEISDSGPGIPPEVLERIFEPFFTTKRDGTGLGLATVQRLVEQHGGSIQVSSQRDHGACFRIELASAEADS
jgi:two-component system sensor histidine kinase PilS (NtrC family)